MYAEDTRLYLDTIVLHQVIDRKNFVALLMSTSMTLRYRCLRT